MNCLIHADRPAQPITFDLNGPTNLFLCEYDVERWQSLGIKVTTASEPVEKHRRNGVSLPSEAGNSTGSAAVAASS